MQEIKSYEKAKTKNYHSLFHLQATIHPLLDTLVTYLKSDSNYSNVGVTLIRCCSVKIILSIRTIIYYLNESNNHQFSNLRVTKFNYIKIMSQESYFGLSS